MKNYDNRYLSVSLLCVVAFLIFMSCSRSSCGNSHHDIDSSNLEDYHADNDIVMIIGSIADALAVGEPLDTTEYSFEGVLTDGEGHPLYTDIQGSPGVWDVDIISDNTAIIRNVYLGDLLPDYLESYITSSMNLDEKNLVESSELEDDDEAQLIAYGLEGSYLRFETRAAVAPNGLEGTLMSIILTTIPPNP